MTLDDKDWEILNILQEHSDYTTRQIAKSTLIPSTTINNRIRRLKNEGIIKKFTVELDNKKIGKSFTSYVLISVDLAYLKQKKRTKVSLAKEIKKIPNVERVDIVTGISDIIALVRAKDVDEFNKQILTKISNMDGIKQTQSMISLEVF
ncbi:Lrp/AsnC family transcriptional regulator [Nanoarchaeota archaeon]